VTIVSVLAGAALLGVLGALLAIPTAAAIQIVLHDWWSHRDHGTDAAPVVTSSASEHQPWPTQENSNTAA
jgi:predicted PurR-regulated permease PerM